MTRRVPAVVSRPMGAALLVAALSVLAHLPAIWNGFVFDDHAEIEANRSLIEPFSLRAIFSSEYWGANDTETRTGWYRPLALLVQRLTYAAAGTDPRPYHLTVLLAHAASAALLAWILMARFGLPRAGVAAGILFGVHAVHAETVSTAYGLKEVLAGLLSLAAFAALTGWKEDAPWNRLARLALSGVFLALAVLSKESAAPVVAALIASDLLRGSPWARLTDAIHRNLRVTLFHGAFLASMLAGAVSMRLPVVGGVLSQVPLSPITNPIVGLAQPARLAMGLRIAAVYARMLVFPIPFTVSYAAGAIPVPSSLLAPDVLIGAALLLLLVSAVVRAHRLRAPAGIGAAWAAATYLLASNLVLPFSTMMSERFLYLPSMGLAMIAAPGMERLLEGARRKQASARHPVARMLPALALGAAALALGAVSYLRAPLYGEDRRLTEACGRWFPDGVVVRLAHASRLIQDERYDEAETALKRLRDDSPGLPSLEEHFAVLAYDRGRKDESAVHYARAAAGRYASVGTSLAYAELLVELGRSDEAIVQLTGAFRAARGDYRDMARARELRGVLLMKRGRTTQGLCDLRLACAINPNLPAAWLDLASYLDAARDDAGAEEAFRRALALRPGDAGTLRASARFFLGKRRGEEAATLLERACSLEPRDLTCLSDLGTAWVQARRLDRARTAFEQLLERSPTHFVALATLGSIDEREGRESEALGLYERYLTSGPKEDSLTAEVRARRARLRGGA